MARCQQPRCKLFFFVATTENFTIPLSTSFTFVLTLNDF